MLILGIDEAGRGPVVGSMVIAGVLMDSKHAEKLARRNIADGTITFEPELVLLPLGPGGMGLGMHMKY